MSGGHDPEEFLNWSDTKLSLAAGAAMRLEAWKVEQLAKALGGEK